MSDKSFYISEEGLQKMKDEVRGLKTVKRKEIAERIREAKELGDLSENAEYIEAKEEQGFIEARITELEQKIKNAVVIEEGVSSDTVTIGSSFTAKNADGDAFTFMIVGSSEADPSQSKISNESPLGEAFLGHKAGDTVDVETPSGKATYSIESID